MADQEGKDFSEDIAEQNFSEQNGDAENAGGGGDAADNSQESQEDRKLFVGGLSWETTDKELREHFSAYGDIESINVKTDPNTGRSRGFAFIVFAKAESLDKIMGAGDHVINNKKVDPKKAKARHGKIFVGGLSTELSDDDIKNFFSQFGTIVEVEMPFDKTKNQRKGFCFITFESEQVVNELLKTSKQTINGKEVDVKKATPKPDGMIGMRGGPGTRGGRGGRGGRGRGFGQSGWGGQGGYGSSYGGGYGQGGYGSGYDGYGGYGDYYGGGGYGGYGGYDYSGYDGYGYGGGNYDGGYSGGRGGARGKVSCKDKRALYTTGWEGLTNNVLHMGMFQEVQAMVASREVVVRTRGINPINEEILLICDRNAICIVTAGVTERDSRSRLHYSSNHSTKSRYLRQQNRKANIQKSEF